MERLNESSSISKDIDHLTYVGLEILEKSKTKISIKIMNFHIFCILSLIKSLFFKYSNYHEFCFYVHNKTPNLNLVQCGMTKQRRFNTRTMIKMKFENIKTKFIKVAIFKKETFCSRFKCKNKKKLGFQY